MKICFILCFSWLILIKLCASSTKEYIPQVELFWSRPLTSMAICLLSFVRKQQLKQILLCWPIRAPDQIPNRFYVISMEFTLLKRGHLSWRNIPSNEEPGEKAVLCLFPETGPGPPFYVVNDPRPSKKFTICLTWDHGSIFVLLLKYNSGGMGKESSFISQLF